MMHCEHTVITTECNVHLISWVRDKGVLKILQYILARTKCYIEFKKLVNTSLSKQVRVIEWKKKKKKNPDFFPHLSLFSIPIQVWKTSLQISILCQHFFEYSFFCTNPVIMTLNELKVPPFILQLCGSRKYPYPPRRVFPLWPATPLDFPFQRVWPYSPPPPGNSTILPLGPLPLGKSISTKKKKKKKKNKIRVISIYFITIYLRPSSNVELFMCRI